MEINKALTISELFVFLSVDSVTRWLDYLAIYKNKKIAQ